MSSTLESSDRAPSSLLCKVVQHISLMSMGFVLVGSLPQAGFSQEPAATYSTLTAPGAGTKSGQGTFAISMNDPGVIAGFYVNSGSYTDSTAVYHGFLRTAGGAYTTCGHQWSGDDRWTRDRREGR
jgi:hypothetical protein